ncbi:MAG: DNA alkylation repair protein, partial [Patescibacteria group bacterium]
MTVKVKKIINHIKKYSKEKNRQGMARFGIRVEYALGASMPVLRDLAKKLGKDHKLAAELWVTKIHEARILACLIDDPKLVSETQMEKWVSAFNSWDLCDQCCMNLFDKTGLAEKKAIEWARRKEEFVRRAGFALMAVLAVHDKEMPDKDFLKFFSLIEKTASDERNFVKKA